MLVAKRRSDLCLRTENGRSYGQVGHVAPFSTSHGRDATQPVSGAQWRGAFLESNLPRQLGHSPAVPFMVAGRNH